MNHTRTRAAFGAAAVIATLLASGAGVSPAVAATTGDHSAQAGHVVGKSQHKNKDRDKDRDKDKEKDKGGKSDADKLAKAVRKLDEAFERQLERAAKKLEDEGYALVAVNVAADRALLAGLTTRSEVRALQPENYDKVIAWLRKVERLSGKVDAPDPAITEAASAVVAQLATITASSARTDLRAAQDLLGALKVLVHAALGEVEEEDEVEDEDEDEDEGGVTEGGVTEGGVTEPGDPAGV